MANPTLSIPGSHRGGCFVSSPTRASVRYRFTPSPILEPLLTDHAVIFNILPISPKATLLRPKWLVHKDAIEGVDYDLENLTQL